METFITFAPSVILPYNSFIKIDNGIKYNNLLSVCQKSGRKAVSTALVYRENCVDWTPIDINPPIWPPEPWNPSGFFVSDGTIYSRSFFFHSFDRQIRWDHSGWWLGKWTTQFHLYSDPSISTFLPYLSDHCKMGPTSRGSFTSKRLW
jgi:hypothetical protein